MRGYYTLAGRTVEIESIYPRVHDYWKDYKSSGSGEAAPDIAVRISSADIEFEKGRSEHASPDDYLEELAVYRKVCEKMVSFDTFLFHASCVVRDGEAYMFAAPSGTGKSTHAALWCRAFEDAYVLNDDKPLIYASESDERAVVYGTPYCGKHRRGINSSAPLKAFCIVTRGEENSIRKMEQSEAFPFLMRQTYRPSDRILLQETLVLLERALSRSEIYMLKCNMDIEAAYTAYEGMKG